MVTDVVIGGSTQCSCALKPVIVRSELQRETSRLNGAKSHGPVTASGKQRSRINALRHGLFSRVLPQINTRQTDKTSFDVMLKNLIDELKPESQLELMHIEILAVDLFHLQRVLFLINGEVDDDQFTRESSIDYDDAYMLSEIWENSKQTLLKLLEHFEEGVPIELSDAQLDGAASTLWHVMTEAREKLKNLPPVRRTPDGPPKGESYLEMEWRDWRERHKMYDPRGVGLRTEADVRDVIAAKRSIDPVHFDGWIRRLRESIKWTAERAKRKRHSIEKTESKEKRGGFHTAASLETLLRIEAHFRRQIRHDYELLDHVRRLRTA